MSTSHWTPARIGELITIATALIVGGLWLGSLNTRVEAGEKQLTRVAEVADTAPTDVAVLKNQMANVERSIQDVKAQQSKDAEKLDRILDEVRRK